ncbi:hypothetical protein RGUI_3049 [Rhodovulum sp. P5]|uniref:invasion associated locus B family protein n=1 Tax=Rhodovulum sp. P5 TaxID=1564506 RepID=UPI0009C33550|nr:invasion associated locus B family protein [Rhodovulum sp. P5]ARE41190.1 hypothetical protein RGUI_3049 [Rhodovulum sp. P5]
MTSLKRVLFAGLLAAVPVLPAAAQTPVANGASFGDWQVICEAPAMNQTVCAIKQTLTFRETGALLGEVVLREVTVEGEQRTLMVLNTPTGMFLPITPGYRIDGTEGTLPLQWRTCSDRACSASRLLTADETAALRRGVRMIIGYRPVNREEAVLFNVSLKGVTAGLNALTQ